mgnify:FL=1
MAGHFVADKDDIVADDIDILPAYPDVIETAEDAERPLPKNDDRYHFARAGVYLHIADIAQTGAVFFVDDLFIS